MNNKINLYKKPTYVSIFAVFAVFMIIATLLDLQISKALSNPSSLYANFFHKAGEIPYFSALLIGSTILYQNNTWNKGKQRILKIMYLGGILAGSFMLWAHIADNFFISNLPYYYIYIIYFSIITAFLTIVSTNHIDKNTINKLVFFAIFLLLLAILSRLLTGLFKEIWLRLRFNYMDPGSYAGFTPWYKPNFTIDGRIQYVFGNYQATAFRSFISGHTTSAAVSYAIIILPDIFVGLKKHAKWFYIAPTAYIALVAFSRVILGVHFLSDVTVAFMLSFIIASFLRWLYFKNKFFLKTRQFELVT